MKEYWRDIVHDDIIDGYEISTNARIRAKNSICEPISKYRTSNGFHYVDLVTKDSLNLGNNVTKSFRVDNLVATAFCHISEELKDKEVVVNHIDGNKKNDVYENLEWIEDVLTIKLNIGKDNRVRISIKHSDGSMDFKSYPRYLMEQELGRELLPNEDVHHIDENPLNNDISNLAIIKHGEHQRQHTLYNYHDQYVKCDSCGKEFLWTRDQQMRYYHDLKAGRIRYKTCSTSCRSRIGRFRQIGKPIEPHPTIEYRETGHIVNQ